MIFYIVVWSGGYEPAQYKAFTSMNDAWETVLKWYEHLEEGVDTIDLLKLDSETLKIYRLNAALCEFHEIPNPVCQFCVTSES